MAKSLTLAINPGIAPCHSMGLDLFPLQLCLAAVATVFPGVQP